MKYCNHCRTFIDTSKKFCNFCGNNVAETFDLGIVKWLLIGLLTVLAFFSVRGCLNDESDITTKTWKYGITFEQYCMIKHASSVAGINDNIEFEKIKLESNFKGSAVSHKGALGEAQVMPSIAGHYRLCPWKSYDNILCGALEYRACRKKSDNNYFALMRYHAGKNRKVFPIVSYAYADKILRGVM